MGANDLEILFSSGYSACNHIWYYLPFDM